MTAAYEATLAALGAAMAAGVPTVLWGNPGEGKTSVVEAAAAGLGLHLEVVIASVREPSDFAGLPVVDSSTGRVRLAPPEWALRLADAAARGQRPAVFFDEVSCATPATQASLLRVICDRVVGDITLPADTVVLAAANPPSVAADGWDLAAPMANRFCHLDWRLPAQVVADGFLDAFPAPPVPELPEDLTRWLRAAYAQVAAYLRARPTDTSVLPDDRAAASRGFPTPRTWEYAARLMAVCAAAGLSEDARRLVVAGVVGDAAALQLLGFLDALDLPDPEQILAAPDALVLPERGDRAYAVLAAVVAAVLADPTPQRWRAGVQAVCQAALQGRADVGAGVMTALVRNRPRIAGRDVPLPEQIKAFLPVLRAAGLVA